MKCFIWTLLSSTEDCHIPSLSFNTCAKPQLFHITLHPYLVRDQTFKIVLFRVKRRHQYFKMDKEEYHTGVEMKKTYVDETPAYDEPNTLVETKGIQLGEAADMYGDIGQAEEYGYVSRG